MNSLEDALRAALMYGLVPLWAAAGVGDWFCHRWQRIEHSTGVGESLLHLLMLAILAPATLAVMWLEVNTLLLLLALVACVAHELVFWADLVYASRRRVIPPIEQWVHSVQFAVPWVGLAGLALLHRDQISALWHAPGAHTLQWTLYPKVHPLPPDYLMVVMLGGAVVIGLPFVQELWRCWRARPRAQAIRPASLSREAAAAVR
jgi:hypothetical protein